MNQKIKSIKRTIHTKSKFLRLPANPSSAAKAWFRKELKWLGYSENQIESIMNQPSEQFQETENIFSKYNTSRSEREILVFYGYTQRQIGRITSNLIELGVFNEIEQQDHRLTKRDLLKMAISREELRKELKRQIIQEVYENLLFDKIFGYFLIFQ